MLLDRNVQSSKMVHAAFLLGLGHVIAGAGLGRAMAYHGADVLNIWRPQDFEMDLTYYTANVGMRSATLDIAESSAKV
jgi:crotonobetainyl-CoA:carnitine CoA-transferase CaiB-like acyl-CoA transferase